MKNYTSNIMVVNKMIIFLDNYLEEPIDFELFQPKLDNDVRLINDILNNIIETFVYEEKENPRENENFSKLTFSVLHRFNKFLNRFTFYITANKIEYDLAGILFITNEINKKIQLLNSLHQGKEIKKKNKQYINENEYAMLFQTLEE